MNYFYVITLSDGRGRATLQGIHTAPQGETRQQAFQSILAWAQQQIGVSQAVVEFFFLEPNQLGGTS